MSFVDNVLISCVVYSVAGDVYSVSSLLFEGQV